MAFERVGWFNMKRGPQSGQRQAGSIPGKTDCHRQKQAGFSETRAGTGQRQVGLRFGGQAGNHWMTKNKVGECDCKLIYLNTVDDEVMR